MNVTLEHLGPCKKLLRIEVEAARVNEVFDAITGKYNKQVAMPGFRPGKAPQDLVLKRFAEQIETEVKQSVYSEAFKTALKQHSLQAVTDPDIEELQFGRDQDAKLAFTVETLPEFELPEYRGLPAQRINAKVSDEDISRALTALQERKSTFQTVNRPAQAGDFVVVNYKGTCEGKPITALVPEAKGLTEQNGFWLQLEKDSFIPGFTEQLHGATPGVPRTVTVNFAADFVTTQLQNKTGEFEVTVTEVKERSLPPLDESFAALWKAESLQQLREGVRSDLQNELNSKVLRSIRTQLVDNLMQRVNFELPETVVGNETRRVVYRIVADNQQRGVAKELIDQQKDEIVKSAAQTAKERVKASYVFSKIASKEGIKVSNEEFSTRISQMARSYNMTGDKLIKELQKQNGMEEVVGQLLNEKVVDFLQQQAKITDAEPNPQA